MRPVRLELTATRLKGGCSTTELRAHLLLFDYIYIVAQMESLNQDFSTILRRRTKITL